MINKIIYILLFIFSYSYMQANERSDYILAGTVRDSQTKEVLSFATLQLIAENKTSYAVITDSNGRYHFANLPVGKYTFRVSFLGYDKKEEILQVKGGVTLTIDMESNTVNDKKRVLFSRC